MARVKQIIGWTAIVLFAVTLAGIWVLTEQNAVETSLLSESTARVVEGQATGVQAADATGEAQTENGMTGAPIWLPRLSGLADLLPFACGWSTNVRRVAHTVEFFFVGLFASVVVVCLSRRPWSVCSRCVPVLLFCAACSVGDRCIRCFVPRQAFRRYRSRIRCCGLCHRHAVGIAGGGVGAPCDSADRRPCEALAGNKPVSNATSLNYFVSRVFPERSDLRASGRTLALYCATMRHNVPQKAVVSGTNRSLVFNSSQRRCLRWQTDCFCGFASVSSARARRAQCHRICKRSSARGGRAVRPRFCRCHVLLALEHFALLQAFGFCGLQGVPARTDCRAGA